MSTREKSVRNENSEGLKCDSSAINELAVKLTSELNIDSVKTDAITVHLEDDINNIESKLSSLTITSVKTEDLSHLTSSVFISRGPSPKFWKRERKTPFSRKSESIFLSSKDYQSCFLNDSNFLHYCGGGILSAPNIPITDSLSHPNLQTLTSSSFYIETPALSPSNVLNGGDSTGIPSPLNCSYGSPSSNASLSSPASNESRPDSGYGGYDNITDNSSELVSNPSVSPTEICINAEFVTPLHEIIHQPLATDSTDNDKQSETKKINELKEMLKDVHEISEQCPDPNSNSGKAKSDEINEWLHDIEEFIHNDTAKYDSPQTQQLTNNIFPQNNLITQSVCHEITQNTPIILQVVLKRNPDNQKKYTKILPKTAMPIQESSQKRSIGNAIKNTACYPAKQKFEKSLDQERKHLCHKMILQETSKGNSFIKEDPKTGKINLHSFIIQDDKENVYILIELTKKWNVKEKLIAELEKQDKEGKRALWYAAYHNELLLVDYLLECGVDPCLKDAQGNTALHCAAECGDSHLDVVQKLCSASPYVINKKNNKGFTALHSAVYHYVKHKNESDDSQFKIILELLIRGSKLCDQDHLKKTPLHWSVHARNLKLIKLLCEKANDTKKAINIQDIHGSTVLHEIAALDISMDVKVEIIVLLLSYNAFSSIKDNSQQRPSDKLVPFCPKVQECLQWEWCGNFWKHIN